MRHGASRATSPSCQTCLQRATEGVGLAQRPLYLANEASPSTLPLATLERLASLHVELPSDRAFPLGTFLRHLKLFRMTIQQDPYEMDETDPWWFVPLLYIGLGLAIAGLAMAGLHLIVALGVR